jgi:hypothetical protein
MSEPFWRTLDNARNGTCSEDNIVSIIYQYSHRREHKALDIIPEAGGCVGANWRAPDASIEENIWKNLD